MIKIRLKSPVLAMLIVLAAAPDAAYADAQLDITYCKTISDNTARLACYDKAGGEFAATNSWTGSGTTNLPPFTVSGAWTLHWSVDDSFMSIDIKNNPNDQMPTDTVSSSTPGTSSSYESIPGTIYLSVTSASSWHIWVTPAN